MPKEYAKYGLQVISSGKLMFITRPEGQESFGFTENEAEAWTFYSIHSVNKWLEQLSYSERGSYLITAIK